MDLEAAIAHGATALASVGGGGFFVRLLFKSLLKRQEKHDKVLDKLVDVVTRLDERVKALLDRDKSTEHAVAIAILKERTEKHQRDLNGLGSKLRGASQ